MTDDIDDLVDKAEAPQGQQELITRAGQDELFCTLYVKTLSPSKAAELAYRIGHDSAKKNGWRALHRPHIAARVAYLMEQASQDANVHPRQLIDELRAHAFADPLEMFSDDTLAQLGLSNITSDTRRAISALEFDALYDYEEDDDGRRHKVQIGNRVKVKYHDKQNAANMLLKVFGVLKERMEHTGADGKPLLPEGMTPESAQILAAKIASILARAERRMLEQQTKPDEEESVEDLV